MRRISKRIMTILMVVSLLIPAGLGSTAVLAADVPACSGTSVGGVIVGIDANGVITIDTNGAEAGGLCTVTITEGEGQDHPIVALLGEYFGVNDPQASDYTGALTSASGCALDDGSGNYSWVTCDTAGSVAVQVIAYDEATGTFTAMLVSDNTQTITFTIADATVSGPIIDALAGLAVSWAIDENGDVILTGEQIALYHDQGLGFGVLTKLYAISQLSGVPVADLVLAFQGGTGMGKLFKLYGKPALLGVGHVRKALKNAESSTNTTTTVTTNGNGKGKQNQGNNKNNKENNSNGKGKAKGKNK